jgi:hypothetical protein
MTPEVLAGSYRRYKDDTAVFTTWLSNRVKACGFTPATKPQTSSKENVSEAPKALKLKGRERKLARHAAMLEKKIPSPYSKDPIASTTVKYTIPIQSRNRL